VGGTGTYLRINHTTSLNIKEAKVEVNNEKRIENEFAIIQSTHNYEKKKYPIGNALPAYSA